MRIPVHGNPSCALDINRWNSGIPSFLLFHLSCILDHYVYLVMFVCWSFGLSNMRVSTYTKTSSSIHANVCYRLTIVLPMHFISIVRLYRPALFRRHGEGTLAGLEFEVIDTAGLEEVHGYLDTVDKSEAQLIHGKPLNLDLQAGILSQTEQAVHEAVCMGDRGDRGVVCV